MDDKQQRTRVGERVRRQAVDNAWCDLLFRNNQSLMKMRQVIASIFLVLLCFSAAGKATYTEIENAVSDGEFGAMQAMIANNGGLESDTAILALIGSAIAGQREMVEKLLDLGIAVDAVPREGSSAGHTALLYAGLHAQREVVEFLLKRGANANHLGHCNSVRKSACEGHSVLVAAVEGGSPEIVRLLLAAGADPNVMKSWPVGLANKCGEVKIFNMLKDAGGRLPTTTESKPNVVATVLKENSIPLRNFGVSELIPGNTIVAVDASATNQCRIAIISDDANLVAADLLLAKLANVPSIQVVERNDIDRIFAEQKLTRAFASTPANYGSIATLLRAQALLLVRNQKLAGTPVVEARFIRVNPGIVLDTVFRASPIDVESWAEHTSQRVQHLANKAASRKAIALSLREVRASLPSAGTRKLEQTLSLVLRDRLINNPKFIVLERTEIQSLAVESGDTEAFWTGNFVVDPTVDIALNGSGDFTLTVRLEPLSGGKAISASASANMTNASSAMDAVMSKVEAELGLPALAEVKASTEAANFLEEAHWAQLAGMPARTHAAAETAWALGLQTLEVARLRVVGSVRASQDECLKSSKTIGANAAEWIDPMIQSIAVWNDVLHGKILAPESPELESWLELAPLVSDGALLAYLSVETAVGRIDHATRLETLRQSYKTAINQAWVRSADLRNKPPLQRIISQIQINSARVLYPDARELVPALQELFSRGLPSGTGTNPQLEDTQTTTAIRLGLHWQHSSITISNHKGSGTRILPLTKDPESKSAVLQWLDQSARPEDRFIGAVIRAECEGRPILSHQGAARMMEAFWDMRDFFVRSPDTFAPYYQRFISLTDGEPMGNSGTQYRNFRVKLNMGATGKQKLEITGPEFCKRMYDSLVIEKRAGGGTFEKLAVRGRLNTDAARNAPPQRPGGVYRNGVRIAESLEELHPPIPANAAIPAMPVRHFWHPFDLGLNVAPEMRQVGNFIWHGGRLWFYGYAYKSWETPPTIQSYVFALDPTSMKTESYVVPNIVLKAYGDVSLVITDTQIAYTIKGQFLAVCDRATRNWNFYNEIKPFGAPILKENSLYLLVEDGNGIVRFDLREKTSEIVASTRRKPDQTVLDDPALLYLRFWENPFGEIEIAASTENGEWNKGMVSFHAFSPVTREWRVSKPATVRRSTFVPTEHRNGIPGIGKTGPNGSTDGTYLLTISNPSIALERFPIKLSPSAPLRLPSSRHGPQQVGLAKGACWSFPGGLIFRPMASCGFWFVPQQEFDEYLTTAVAADRSSTTSNGASK